MSRRRSTGSETVTVRAPSSFAQAAVVRPTAPAPMTSTSSVGSILARRAVCSPTANGSTSAPCCSGRSSGSGNASAALTRIWSANPPGAPPRPMSAAPSQWATSPTEQCRQTPHEKTGSTAARMPSRQVAPAAAPTATTSPQSSWPITVPGGIIGRALRSEPHTPQPVTRSTRSSGPGTGSGRSSTPKAASAPRVAARIRRRRGTRACPGCRGSAWCGRPRRPGAASPR